MARHRVGAPLLWEGRGRAATLRVVDVRPLPAVADERRRAALGERDARVGVRLVVGLARPREAEHHLLERVQAIGRLRRSERALPLAALAGGDLAAVVRDV